MPHQLVFLEDSIPTCSNGFIIFFYELSEVRKVQNREMLSNTV
jgi:hypothetical protein